MGKYSLDLTSEAKDVNVCELGRKEAEGCLLPSFLLLHVKFPLN